MTRNLHWFVLAFSPVLLCPSPAQAQRRCPFNPQAQVQVQIMWQRQTQLQSVQRPVARPVSTARSVTTLQRPQSIPRAAGPSMPMRPGTPSIQRTTSISRVTRPVTTNTVRVSTSRRTITTTLRPVGIGRCGKPGSGGGSLVQPRRITVTRTITNTSRQLQRITRPQTTVQTRQSVTRRISASTPRSIPTIARRPASTPQRTATTLQRARTVPSMTRQTRQVTTHRPTVQVRVTMGMQCGSCHMCTQNRPSITRLPQRMPYPTAQRPQVGYPTMPRYPRPNTLVQLRPQPGPMVGPRPTPVVLPTMVRRPQVIPLTVLRPPTLPPLTIARTGTNQPTIESIVAGKPTRSGGDASPGETMAKARPALTDDAPALPVLSGSVTSLSPLLLGTKKAERPRPVASGRDEIAPDSVTSAPPLAKLPASDRQLLPNLDGEEAPPAPMSRTSPIELVRQAPPLPPLSESN